ncbi:RNase P/RNase MRP complex subunit [Microbotryomycetes sp. JL221]|nr:RNase P/RNase MRP complex subunit [Microbotryomycetes sp. JL221]
MERQGGTTAPSAWNPYNPLSQATRKRLNTQTLEAIDSWPKQLNIDVDDVTERVSKKLLQLETPSGKVSDKRKAELDKRAEKRRARADLTERLKRKDLKRLEQGCGLHGKKRRMQTPPQNQTKLNFTAAQAIHHLWLGYMAELLQLPLKVPPLVTTPSSSQQAGTPEAPSTTLASLYPMFPTRGSKRDAPPLEPQINVNTVQTKLLKAEFVGCKLRVKRAKNPALLNIEGIVVQETQQTFKLAVPKAPVKGDAHPTTMAQSQ